MIVQCAQSKDQGSVCHPGYKLVWYYDTTEGRCMEFWYGGCDGNQNRFGSREACEKVCVEPPGIGKLINRKSSRRIRFQEDATCRRSRDHCVAISLWLGTGTTTTLASVPLSGGEDASATPTTSRAGRPAARLAKMLDRYQLNPNQLSQKSSSH